MSVFPGLGDLEDTGERKRYHGSGNISVSSVNSTPVKILEEARTSTERSACK